MARRTSDSANELYKEIAAVVIGEYEYKVFGSMSWTVAEVRKVPWETLQKAYIELTGDQRPEVNRDTATNVVCGHLQFTWAELKNRPDLKDTLTANQAKRIADALVSTQPVPKVRNIRRSGVGTSKPESMDMSDSNTSAPTAEGEGGTPPAAVDETPRTIPKRGAMGKAAEVINSGVTDGPTIEKAVVEAYPDVKNVKRHIQYVAKTLKVKLTWPKKEEPAAPPMPANEPPSAAPEAPAAAQA